MENKNKLCNSQRFKSLIEHERNRGFKTYISLVRKKGTKEWRVHEMLSGLNLTKSDAKKSAQKQFLYDNATRLNMEYPRKVKEDYDWDIIACR
jgi:hypothetical protein